MFGVSDAALERLRERAAGETQAAPLSPAERRLAHEVECATEHARAVAKSHRAALAHGDRVMEEWYPSGVLGLDSPGMGEGRTTYYGGTAAAAARRAARAATADAARRTTLVTEGRTARTRGYDIITGAARDAGEASSPRGGGGSGGGGGGASLAATATASAAAPAAGVSATTARDGTLHYSGMSVLTHHAEPSPPRRRARETEVTTARWTRVFQHNNPGRSFNIVTGGLHAAAPYLPDIAAAAAAESAASAVAATTFGTVAPTIHYSATPRSLPSTAATSLPGTPRMPGTPAMRPGCLD